MKKLTILLLIPFVFIVALYLSGVFVINAAQMDVEDMDVKVIYHYEDGDTFVGYNERSRINFEEGHIGFQNKYDKVYKTYVDDHVGMYYYVDFGDEIVESSHHARILELCIYQQDLKVEITDTSFLKDHIHFSFSGTIEAYNQDFFGQRKAFTKNERDFLVEGNFDITGIYDDEYIDYQIKRLILYKLRYTVDDYFVGYHGINHMNWFRAQWMRYFDGMIRFGMGLPYHSAWKFKTKDPE